MTIIIQDSFNRADSTTSLGVADSGQTWQVGGTATFGVIGNQGYAATSTQDNTGAYIPISNTIKDYKATITVPTIQTSTTNFFRFYPRVAFGTLLYYLAIEAYSTGYRISKRTSTGTTSIVATSAVIPVSGDTIRVDNKASGQMDVYINGTLIITATDTYMMDLTYGVGFGGKQAPTYRVDNFLVETLDVTPTFTDGSTMFDTKQSIYQDNSITLDTKQTIYSDSYVKFDTKQGLYSDSQVVFNTKQTYYNDSFVSFDTLQVIEKIDWVDGSVSFDTQQLITETPKIVAQEVNLTFIVENEVNLSSEIENSVSLSFTI
jgi:hypothetical protein